jgi:hypothetical protein
MRRTPPQRLACQSYGESIAVAAVMQLTRHPRRTGVAKAMEFSYIRSID